MSELAECFLSLERSIECLGGRDLEEVSSQLSPLESAKLKVSLAYGLASLTYTHLQLEGKSSPGSHPIRGEIDRIKEYVARVKALEAKKKTEEEDNSKAERSRRVDEEAAKRIVQFELNKNVAALTSSSLPMRKKTKR